MEDQLDALCLILNTIALWNTVYLDPAIEQLRADGYPVARHRCRRQGTPLCESDPAQDHDRDVVA